MRFPRWRQAVIASTLLIVLWSAGINHALPTATTAQPIRAATTPYQGAGSCSAVACHGSISPVAGSTVLRNEHTTWVSDDKHSRAFQVLFDDRSKQIALNLAGDKDLVPAHEDPRCLACHTTPRTASERRDTPWMNQDGVGCESCHGTAKEWLGPHTTDGWKSRDSSPAVKESYGFTDTKNVVRRLEVCVGCHVGHDGQEGLTARDVNHDLIAAGHPRLTFEFTAYQANQPPHWDVSKPGAAEAAADFPARAWAVGQLVSGKAALQLLAARAAHVAQQPGLPSALPIPGDASAPWPEFSEFGCFSCHHGLADEPWRRNRLAAGASPGVPAWGSWQFPLTAALFANSGIGDRARVGEFVTALESLTGEMSRSIADAVKVRRLAETGIKIIDPLIREFSLLPDGSSPVDANVVNKLITGLNDSDAWNTVASWDHAAQRYLALVPLNQARRKLDPIQPDLAEDLRKILSRLTFPTGFDSPRGFDPRRVLDGVPVRLPRR
jgi:Cytochrome c554 and c-prime